LPEVAPPNQVQAGLVRFQSTSHFPTHIAMPDPTITIKVIEDSPQAHQSSGSGGSGGPPIPPAGGSFESGEEDSIWKRLLDKVAGALKIPDSLTQYVKETISPSDSPGKSTVTSEHHRSGVEQADYVASSASRAIPKATTYKGTDAEASGLQSVLPAEGGGAGGASIGGAASGAGEGAAGAGALGAAAALAVPVGIAAAAMYAVGKAGDVAAKGITSLVDEVSALVSHDYFAIFDQSMHKVIDTVDSIPLIGPALDAIPKVALAAIDGMKQLTDAFIQEANRLAKYSGDISIAQAGAEVRSLQQDLKEANAMGPGMARLIESQSKIETTMREIVLPIKTFVVEILANLLEKIVGFLEAFKDMYNNAVDAIAKMGRVVLAELTAGISELVGLGEKLQEGLEMLKIILRKEPEYIFDFDDAFKTNQFRDRNASYHRPNAQAAQHPFNVPALQPFRP
jgi:hypothetical protein